MPRGERWSSVGDAGTQTNETRDVFATRTLSGSLTYDFVPHTLDGLDYDAIEVRPIRGARVQALRASDDELLGETTTDNAGDFTLVVDESATARVQFFAETVTPHIRIEDNTWDDLVWVGISEEIDIDGFSGPLELHASTGWDGATYSDRRLAAPFAMLDTFYEAAHALGQPRSADLDPLVVNWSPSNRPQSGDVESGLIGLTHWDPVTREMFVLGAADENTDEFDRHVLLHEWGHYIEQTTARSDNIGGAHLGPVALDARVAFSEGWANAVSAAVLAPDTVYRDSAGVGQASTAISFDVEDSPDPNPGWFSETSCQSIIYDAIDAANEESDTLDLGLGTVHDALVDHASTDGFTTIFSFLDAIRELNPNSEEALTRLTERHLFGPVVDEFGTAESADGGWNANLPIYHQIAVGQRSVELIVGLDAQQNGVGRNRYVLFAGLGGDVWLDITVGGSVEVGVYDRGDEVASGSVQSSGRILVPTEAGRTYAVSVRATERVARAYVCSLKVVEG